MDLHTTECIEVVMVGTCSAASPAVVQRCADPDGFLYFRTVAELEVTHVELTPRGDGPVGDFNEYPQRFQAIDAPDGVEETLANASLYANAHLLLASLRTICEASERNAVADWMLEEARKCVAAASTPYVPVATTLVQPNVARAI